MGFIFSVAGALILWIVLWSIGVKSIDAFMLTVLIVLLAAGTRMLMPYLPGKES